MEQVGGSRVGRHGTYGSLRLGPVTLTGKTNWIDDSDGADRERFVASAASSIGTGRASACLAVDPYGDIDEDERSRQSRRRRLPYAHPDGGHPLPSQRECPPGRGGQLQCPHNRSARLHFRPCRIKRGPQEVEGTTVSPSQSLCTPSFLRITGVVPRGARRVAWEGYAPSCGNRAGATIRVFSLRRTARPAAEPLGLVTYLTAV